MMILPILTLLLFQGTAGLGRNVFRLTDDEVNIIHYANRWVKDALDHQQQVRTIIMKNYGNENVVVGLSDGDGCWPRTTTTCTIEGDYVVCIDSTEKECITVVKE